MARLQSRLRMILWPKNPKLDDVIHALNQLANQVESNTDRIDKILGEQERTISRVKAALTRQVWAQRRGRKL